MNQAKIPLHEQELRSQTDKAKSLAGVVLETVKLWKKHHLSYDQSKQVVEGARQELSLSASRKKAW